MKIEEVRKLLHARPFRRFVIHLADGGRISVKHEDFVALAPTGREMIVYQPSGDLPRGGYHVGHPPGGYISQRQAKFAEPITVASRKSKRRPRLASLRFCSPMLR